MGGRKKGSLNKITRDLKRGDLSCRRMAAILHIAIVRYGSFVASLDRWANGLGANGTRPRSSIREAL